MQEEEGFQMFAISIDAPYIVGENDISAFFENSRLQEQLAEKIGCLFGKGAFQFELDENGNPAVTINGNQCD